MDRKVTSFFSSVIQTLFPAILHEPTGWLIIIFYKLSVHIPSGLHQL